jgi:hypothetical protein
MATAAALAPAQHHQKDVVQKILGVEIWTGQPARDGVDA